MLNKINLLLYILLVLYGCSEGAQNENIGVTCWPQSEIDDKAQRAEKGESWLYARLADNARLCLEDEKARHWEQLALAAGEPSACHRKIIELREYARNLATGDPRKIILLNEALEYTTVLRNNAGLVEPRDRDISAQSNISLSDTLAREINQEISTVRSEAQ